jgi:hypothetical protein
MLGKDRCSGHGQSKSLMSGSTDAGKRRTLSDIQHLSAQVFFLAVSPRSP